MQRILPGQVSSAIRWTDLRQPNAKVYGLAQCSYRRRQILKLGRLTVARNAKTMIASVIFQCCFNRKTDYCNALQINGNRMYLSSRRLATAGFAPTNRYHHIVGVLKAPSIRQSALSSSALATADPMTSLAL